MADSVVAPSIGSGVGFSTSRRRRRSRRYRYRFRLSGSLYLLVTILIGVAAATRPNNLLVWIFGLLLGSILVSGAVSGFMLMRLAVERLDPRRAVAGVPATIRYEVRNESRWWSAFALRIRERRVGTAEGWDSIADSSPAWVVHVGPREAVHAESEWTPARRGRATFTEVEVASSFPFGLLEKVVWLSLPGEVLVHPRSLPVREEVLAAIRSDRFGGLDLARRPGTGEDFFGVRDYRPGDSVRQIAWKRLAGLDQLAIIERSSSGPPRLAMALDLRTPPERLRELGEPRELEERAIVLVASLARAAMQSGFEVGLDVLGLETPRLSVRIGHRHLERIMGTLAALDLAQPRRGESMRAPADSHTLSLTVRPGRAGPGESGWSISSSQFDRILQVEAPA